jgi:ribonucleoside-diphosphate reductase alpha chain
MRGSIPIEADWPLQGGAALISQHIWRTKYRFAGANPPEADLDFTWRRVARAVAAAEGAQASRWEGRFMALLRDFRFLPGGRILAGAGTGRTVTLFNCFVMGQIEDSIPGIFAALQEAAVTMQQGGGVGLDFSSLRPAGFAAPGSGGVASGPVSFMQLWDAMCATLLSTGSRRGAMMATLRCDHPDIEAFIAARLSSGLHRFNLSVQVTDAFVAAARADRDWPLVFPAGEEGQVVRTVRAGELWRAMLQTAYDCGEPGVLFIDRINRSNNLGYCERISATNPCGEIPLPAYGACDLGSLNLTAFVRDPFSRQARLDLDGLAAAARIAVRFLDDVIEVSRFPLPQHAAAAKGSRRIGLGITGLADALIMLGLRYGESGSLKAARTLMRAIAHAAYQASAELAREKGAFPLFDAEPYLAAPFIAGLPDPVRAAIRAHGTRNSHLLAIAPAGTISLLAGNVSSGLEPVFAAELDRSVLDEAGSPQPFRLTDYAVALWRRTHPDGPTLPPGFVTAAELSPEAHLAMQAALQPFIDSSISKTINVAENCPFEDFAQIYDRAFDLGLKGCTTFRPNPVTGSLLAEAPAADAAPHCCALEREAD